MWAIMEFVMAIVKGVMVAMKIENMKQVHVFLKLAMSQQIAHIQTILKGKAARTMAYHVQKTVPAVEARL